MLTKSILAAVIFGGLAVSSAAMADGETNKLNNNSYQEYAAGTCITSGTGYCQLLFPPTTYTTTVVKAVSCAAVASPGSIAGMELGTSAGDQMFYLPTFIFESEPNTITVTTNATTNMFYNKGDIPTVTAFVSNGGSFLNALGCTITGEHS
jgi:hypothetical protein